MGKGLLTTRMGEVFLRLGQSILSRNASLGQRHAKRVLVQARHPCALRERQPAVGVKAARQLDLHQPFPFAGLQRQAGQNLFINVENNAHGQTMPVGTKHVEATSWCFLSVPKGTFP